MAPGLIAQDRRGVVAVKDLHGPGGERLEDAGAQAVNGGVAEELGYLAGVSRQRANQALRTLEDAGLVRSEYGGIDILDLDGLSRFGE